RFTDRLDPANARQRKRFIAAVIEKVPAAKDQAEALDAELNRLASQPLETPDYKDDEREVDALAVARPELFHTPSVSGITVPVMFSKDGTIGARWRTYLHW